MRHSLLRNLEAWAYLEIFLVSAVAAILGIRGFLELTGYPKLGGGGLHIAHMLWGGLLMLIAIVILLAFLSKASHRLAAVIGGFGFGTFIDEIGKFVTSDNDYFFQPAVALMYITFVATFLAIHTIRTRREHSPQEYLLNALREMEEVALHDLDEEDRRRTMLYLSRCDPDHPLVPALREIVTTAELVPRPAPGPWAAMRQRLQQLYRGLARRRVFAKGVTIFFVAKLVLAVGYAVGLILLAGREWELSMVVRLAEYMGERAAGLSFVEIAHLSSSLAAGAFTLAGIAQIRRSRLRAFLMFERSVLVSIFVTQVFSFYKEQFGALLGLALNIVVLIGVRFVIEQEQVAAVKTPPVEV